VFPVLLGFVAGAVPELLMGWVDPLAGLGQSTDGLYWIGSHKMDPWTTLGCSYSRSRFVLTTSTEVARRYIMSYSSMQAIINFIRTVTCSKRQFVQ